MDDGNNCASQVHPPIFSLPLKAAASTWLNHVRFMVWFRQEFGGMREK